ncbi:MAG TPA: hypothetical protein VHK90_12295 [Thermoanaerobaculia bacterium]|nr:hypothetical protein [Thermoanaerobaculia bacterium]
MPAWKLIVATILVCVSCSPYGGNVHPAATINIVSVTPLHDSNQAQIVFDLVNHADEPFTYEAPDGDAVIPLQFRRMWLGWRTNVSICGTGMRSFTVPPRSAKRFTYELSEGTVRIGIADLNGRGIALSKIVRIRKDPDPSTRGAALPLQPSAAQRISR